jgi:nucleoside-diphosphate-sugar epimerase
MSLLVTGANGFLGSAIVSQVARTGLWLRATDRGKASCAREVGYCQADILDPKSLLIAMNGITVVIHAAGLAHIFDKSQSTVASFKTVNADGTANVAAAAAQARVRHLIFISSVSVYGGSSSGLTESAACHPEGPYAESKWQAEQRAIEIAQASGMHLTILRLATLYGEGDPGNVARLMRSIDRRRFIWIGEGSNRKSLLHREDAARACVTVLLAPSEGINIYNVSGPPCTMRDVVTVLASALGRHVPAWHVPASWTLRLTGLAAGLTQRCGRLGTLHDTVQKWLVDDYYDAGKFQREYSFQTRVDLAEGLRREVQWYRAGQLKS